MSDITLIGFKLGEIIVYGGVGFIIGWFARGFKEKYKSEINNEKAITLMIAGVYVLSVLVSIANPSYQTPLALHGLMGTVLGFYLKQKPKI